MDGAVEDDAGVNASQFRNASQEATAIAVDVLLAGFPVEITPVVVAVISDAVDPVVVDVVSDAVDPVVVAVESVVCCHW